MPSLTILVNGQANNDINCPIDESVTLSAVVVGVPALSYTWVIVTQPPAGAIVFNGSGGTTSNLATESITPTVQGTVLVSLIINQSNPATALVASAIAGVRQLRTQIRVPAVGEQDEASLQGGWAPEENNSMQVIDGVRGDPGFQTCVSGDGSPVGTIVTFSSSSTQLSGLPEQFLLPETFLALTNSGSNVSQPMGMIAGAVSGSAITAGSLIYVRHTGLQTVGTSFAQGSSLFVSNGALSLSPGTERRIVATALGGTNIFFDGSTQDLIGASGADPNASYLLVSADSLDPNARHVVAGTGITFTDGGAGGTFTIAASGSGAISSIAGAGGTSVTSSAGSYTVSSSVGADPYGTYALYQADAQLPNALVLQGQGNTTVTKSGTSLIISSSGGVGTITTVTGSGGTSVSGGGGPVVTVSSSVYANPQDSYFVAAVGSNNPNDLQLTASSGITFGYNLTHFPPIVSVSVNVTGSGGTSTSFSNGQLIVSSALAGFTSITGSGGTAVTQLSPTSFIVSSSVPNVEQLFGIGGVSVAQQGTNWTISGSAIPTTQFLGTGGTTVTGGTGGTVTVSSSIYAMLKGAYIVAAVDAENPNERLIATTGGISGADGGGGGNFTLSSSVGADRYGSYVLVSADPNDPNARTLTAGSGVTLTDGGAGSTLTIAAAGGGGGSSSGSTHIIASSNTTYTVPNPSGNPTFIGFNSIDTNMTATLPAPAAAQGNPIYFTDLQGFASASSISTLCIQPASTLTTINAVSSSYTHDYPWGTKVFVSFDGISWWTVQ